MTNYLIKKYIFILFATSSVNIYSQTTDFTVGEDIFSSNVYRDEIVINVSNFRQGIYLIEVESAYALLAKRFIKI